MPLVSFEFNHLKYGYFFFKFYQVMIKEERQSVSKMIFRETRVFYFFILTIDQALHQFLTLLLIWTLLPNLTFYLITRGFHRTFATGAACQQRALTPPDTWSCPNLGLASVLMFRSISPELVLFPDFEFWTSLGTSVFWLYVQKLTNKSFPVLDHFFQYHSIRINTRDASKSCHWKFYLSNL